MADHGKLYSGFDGAFPAAMARLTARADVALPNITEACLLTGTPYREEVDEGFARELLRGVAALGAKKVILTGVSFAPDKLGAMGYDSGAGTYFTCLGPRNPASFHGTGDIFAAVVTGGLMRGMTLEQAASLAVEFVLACIDATARDPQAGWYGVEFEKALPLLCERVRELRKTEKENSPAALPQGCCAFNSGSPSACSAGLSSAGVPSGSLSSGFSS